MPVIDWRTRRHFGPARVRVSCAPHGIRDWEVVLADNTVLCFGMALMRAEVPDSVDHPDPSRRERRNPYSELHYRDALRFAEWINKPAGALERVVSWWRRRRAGCK